MHLRPPVRFGLQQSLPRIALLVVLILFLAVLAPILRSQETASTSQPTAGHQTAAADQSAPVPTEQAIRARLEGKQLFLRVFDMGNDLRFDVNGRLEGTTDPGPFTLCAIDVKKVHFSKHRVEIDGNRMGLHFFGALPYEDDKRPFERIRLSKKALRISIEREEVVKPKKRDKADEEAGPPPPANRPFGLESSPAPMDDTPAVTETEAAKSQTLPEEVATSPADAARLLNAAVDKVFADRFDEPYVAALPVYWQHYLAAKPNEAAQGSANIARPGPDVISPKILTSLEPGSNEFAQKYNIAGVATFRTVIDPQGHPEVQSVARPLGFGLDERAVDAIRKANFQPGSQDGKPVSVMVDLVVTFRIYSNRTRGSAVLAMNGAESQKAQVASNPQ